MHKVLYALLLSAALLLCLGAGLVEQAQAQNINNAAYGIGSLVGTIEGLAWFLFLPLTLISVPIIFFTRLPVISSIVSIIMVLVSDLLSIPLRLMFSLVVITPLVSLVIGYLNGFYRFGRFNIVPRFSTLIGIPAIVKALNGARPKVVV